MCDSEDRQMIVMHLFIFLFFNFLVCFRLQILGMIFTFLPINSQKIRRSKSCAPYIIYLHLVYISLVKVPWFVTLYLFYIVIKIRRPTYSRISEYNKSWGLVYANLVEPTKCDIYIIYSSAICVKNRLWLGLLEEFLFC